MARAGDPPAGCPDSGGGRLHDARPRARSAAAGWGGVAIGAIAILAMTACGGAQQTVPPEGREGPADAGDHGRDPNMADADPNIAFEAEENRIPVTLYFVTEDGDLAPEVRRLTRVDPASEMARRIVEELAGGPREGLHPTVPPETTVRALHIGADGTAYLDLDQGFARGLAHGSEDALIAVRSLAETLTTNLPEILRVKILVEGDEVRDLGGHLDLSHPVVPEAATARGGEGSPDGAPR